MNIYTLLDEMDKLLDDGLNLPFTGGKSVIDTESARSILDDLRNTIPQEVRQARAITADRNQILADAKRDGEGIKNKAKEQAERRELRFRSAATDKKAAACVAHNPSYRAGRRNKARRSFGISQSTSGGQDGADLLRQ